MANLPRARTWEFAAFALPAFQTALVHGPVGGIVPTIYATEWGLNLALIGTVLLVSRIFDAVIDPVIGYLSDHTQTRFGRRKPWIAAGAALTMLSTWFLFVPPAHPSIAYFAIWYTASYFAWTLTEIPHSAWAFEITHNYNDRSRVLTLRILATGAGGFLFLLLPFLPIFKTTAFTGETLRAIAVLALVFVPLTIGAALIWAPEGPPLEKTDHYGLKDLFGLFAGNRPLMIFLAGFFLSGFAEGMFGGLSFLYLINFLGMAKQVTIIILVQLVSALLFLPVIPWLIGRFGRLRAWSGSIVVGVGMMGLVLLLPRSPAALGPLLAIMVVLGALVSLKAVAVVGVLGDIVDYDTLKTGKKRAAMFSALYALVVKLNGAVGGSVALILVAAFGYDPKLGTANSAGAQLGMQISYVVAPTALYALAIVFVWLFPITRRRQEIIGRRLGQREARAGGLAVVGGPL